MASPPLLQTPDVVIEQQDTVWTGRCALDLVQFRHRRFNGTMSPPRSWELLRRGTAAAMLPYDPWTDQVVLIEQFRLPAFAAGIHPTLVEIPAGLSEAGETPETTIRREMQEEVGLSADLLAPIAEILLAPGSSDELITLFAGRVHAPPAEPDGSAGQAGLMTELEDIQIRVQPAPLAIERALAGQYPNSVTMIALLWLAARHHTLRAEWLA